MHHLSNCLVYIICPFEKEIVKYIYDLPGDSKFFEKFKMEHNDFTTQFASYRISDLSDLNAIKSASTTSLKIGPRVQDLNSINI